MAAKPAQVGHTPRARCSFCGDPADSVRSSVRRRYTPACSPLEEGRRREDGERGEEAFWRRCSVCGAVTLRALGCAGLTGLVATQVQPGKNGGKVLAAHDITPILRNSAANGSHYAFPLNVVRAYEVSGDGQALVIRFDISLPATAKGPVEIGGLGFPMPEVPGHAPSGIETSLWASPPPPSQRRGHTHRLFCGVWASFSSFACTCACTAPGTPVGRRAGKRSSPPPRTGCVLPLCSVGCAHANARSRPRPRPRS